MRGKLSPASPLFDLMRNIPAYAGKTYDHSEGREIIAEHPRVCGENDIVGAGGSFHCGTSPRMRGKRSASRFDNSSCRNIPAYAGKTIFHLVGRHLSREHPRVCGENGGNSFSHFGVRGTSPRMRGKRWPQTPTLILLRNIPAYAGKT